MKFIIEGGVPLKGKVEISGAKNEATKLIAASLLTDEEVILNKVPRISDVDYTLRMFRSFGGKTKWLGSHRLSLSAAHLHSSSIPASLSQKCRIGLLMVGPLLARLGEANLPNSGGDNFGQRATNRFFDAWASFGATFTQASDGTLVECHHLRGAVINFKRSSHTATESAILTAVLAEGETVISNAAEEPEIDVLISFLDQMGAKVQRVEPRRIVIEGVKNLTGTEFTVGPDGNEAVTLALAAAVTRGEVTLQNLRAADLTAFLSKVGKMGVSYEILEKGTSLKVWLDREKKLTQIDLIQTRPHPGFKTDWQAPFCVLMTQVEGVGLIQETIYINRFAYVKELNRMGAKIELLTATEANLPFILDHDGYNLDKDKEPQTVVKITGPTKLTRERLTVADLRAGATLVLAALCAEGKSEILGAELVDRGYENFDLKLKSLGAKIERVGE